MPYEIAHSPQQANAYLPAAPDETRELWKPFDLGGAAPEQDESAAQSLLPALSDRALRRTKMTAEEAWHDRIAEQEEKGKAAAAAIANAPTLDFAGSGEDAAFARSEQRALISHNMLLAAKWSASDARARANANGFNAAAHAVDMPYTVGHSHQLQRMLVAEARGASAGVPRELGTAAIKLSTKSLTNETVTTSPPSGLFNLLRGSLRRSTAGRHRAA